MDKQQMIEQLTEDRAELAAATKNGNGVQGEAVHIVDALDYSIAKVDRLLGVLKGE